MISVGLPTHGQLILWLAFEGLCRQRNAGSWELIIVEDEVDAKVQDLIRAYAGRLVAAGCEEIKYIFKKDRTSLSQKWRICGEEMDPRSVGLVLQADDDYSDPDRLNRTALQLMQGDWIQARWGHFYHLFAKRSIAFDLFSGVALTGVSIAISGHIARNLNTTDEKWSGVDAWLWAEAHRINPNLSILTFDNSEWKGGIFTDGLNRISRSVRQPFYYDLCAPFVRTDIRLEDHLPADICDQLNQLKKP